MIQIIFIHKNAVTSSKSILQSTPFFPIFLVNVYEWDVSVVHYLMLCDLSPNAAVNEASQIVSAVEKEAFPEIP